MERYFEDHSEASFTTAMATPSKPGGEPLEHTWDAEDTSPAMMDLLDDKENDVSENTQNPRQRPLSFQSPSAKIHAPNALQDEVSNNAGEESGGDTEPSNNPAEVNEDLEVCTDGCNHHEPIVVDVGSSDAEDGNLPSTAGLDSATTTSSSPVHDVSSGVHDVATTGAQSETENCEEVLSDAQENSSEPCSPISDGIDLGESATGHEDVGTVGEVHSEPSDGVGGSNLIVNMGFAGETNIETKVVDVANPADLSAAFEALQVGCRFTPTGENTDAALSPLCVVSEDVKEEDTIIPAVLGEVIRSAISEEVIKEDIVNLAVVEEDNCAAISEKEGKEEQIFVDEFPVVTEKAELCAEPVQSTQHSVEPLLPSLPIKAEPTSIIAECAHDFELMNSSRVPEPSASSSYTSPGAKAGKKKSKKLSKKKKMSAPKKRPSESHVAAAATPNANIDIDLASTYKLEPTIPRGPKLKMLERRPSQNLVVEKKPAEKDFAETYKLEATIPRGPELNAERRCTMAASRRAILGKSPPAPASPKVAIDYAKSYKMQPTIPKSPVFSQKHPKNTVNANGDVNSNRTKVSKATTPDLAFTYKLEPTIPKDLPFRSTKVARRPSKDTIPEDPVPEKERVDYVKFYNGEPTKPNSPNLSFMVKKTTTKSPKLTSTAASPSSSSVGKQQQFKARPLPSYIRRTSSGISPRRSSRMNVSPSAARTHFKARPLPSYIRRTASGLSPRCAPMIASQNKAKSPTFKARPMPNFDRIAIQPRVSPRRGTIYPGDNGSHVASPSRPHNYSSSSSGKAPYVPLSIALHQQAVAAWNLKIEAENRALEERRNFKARPLSADMLEGACFVPVLGQFSPTRPVDVVTYSRDRAQERHQYDVRNAERVCELEHAQQMAEEARRLDEAAKTKERLDKNAFKARPVPQSLYRDPLSEALSPHTPKNKIRRAKRPSTASSSGAMEKNQENNNSNNSAADHGESPASQFSPGDMLANVRKALGKLSPV